jgi:Zn-dependent M28 family amino/carboxypeptidase
LPRFEGSRAFALLEKQVAFGPRNPGSAGHGACRDFLEAELRRHANRVELQNFTHEGYQGERLRLTNIIASFNPPARTRILLAAHWDTRPRAERDPDAGQRSRPIPGANDGASGVAVLLELARLMQSQPPPVGVDIVLFDGEDYGNEGDSQRYLLGAREYARSRVGGRLPVFGILLDMVGDAQLEILREENSVLYAPTVVDLLWTTAARLGIPEFADGPGPAVLDDHIPLIEAGIPTANVIDFEYPDASHRFWHTHDDTPEHCSAASLEAVGRVITHIVYTRTP